MPHAKIFLLFFFFVLLFLPSLASGFAYGGGIRGKMNGSRSTFIGFLPIFLNIWLIFLWYVLLHIFFNTIHLKLRNISTFTFFLSHISSFNFWIILESCLYLVYATISTYILFTKIRINFAFIS